MDCDFTKLANREAAEPARLFSVTVLVVPEKPWTDFSKPPPHEVIDFKANDVEDASNAVADIFQEQNDPGAMKPKWWPNRLVEVTGDGCKDCTPALSDVFYDREIIKLIPVRRAD